MMMGLNDSGAAYIFEFDSANAEWDVKTKISALENNNDLTIEQQLEIQPDTSRRFGDGIDIYGNTLIVGGPRSEAGGNDEGAVRIFERTGTIWEEKVIVGDVKGLQGSNEFINVDLGTHDHFGGAIGYDGKTLVVGAVGDDDGGRERGAAYLFEKTTNIPGYEKKYKISENGNDKSDGFNIINVSGLGQNNYFGSEADVHDTTLVVARHRGDDGHTDAGEVRIFEKNSSGVWSQTLKISDAVGESVLNVDLETHSYFGHGLAIHNNTIAVGAPDENDGGSDRGSVYIFEKDSSGVWSQTLKISDNGGGTGLLDIDLDNKDWFGTSVSLNEDRLFVGAYRDDDGGTERGAVYVFKKTNNGWEKRILKSQTTEVEMERGKFMGLKPWTLI